MGMHQKVHAPQGRGDRWSGGSPRRRTRTPTTGASSHNYKADQRGLINWLSPTTRAFARPRTNVISAKFGVDNGGAIPPNYLDENVLDSMIRDNLIRAANTSASDTYLKGGAS